MAEVQIPSLQPVQVAPQQGIAPGAPVGTVGSAEQLRADQVVTTAPRTNNDSEGQPQDFPEDVDAVAPDAGRDSEQESARIVLDSGSQAVAVRLRYSVSESQVYLEYVNLEDNSRIRRVPPSEVPLPERASSTAELLLSERGTSAAVTDVNADLERVFEGR